MRCGTSVRWCCVTDYYQFIYFYLLRIKLQENEVVTTNIYSSYCCSFIHSFTPFINMPTNQPASRKTPTDYLRIQLISLYHPYACTQYNTVYQLHRHSPSAFWLITVNRMPVQYSLQSLAWVLGLCQVLKCLAVPQRFCFDCISYLFVFIFLLFVCSSSKQVKCEVYFYDI